ncbi:MAG: hypothetical protein U0166_24835 [Acidobacteriota bacterium]
MGRIPAWLAVLAGTAAAVASIVLMPPVAAVARSVEPLLIAAVVVLSWIGLGLPIASRLSSDRLQRTLAALAIGIGETGTFAFVLGIAGSFSIAAFVAWHAAGLLLLAILGRKALPDALPSLDPWNAWGAAVILLFVAVLVPFVAAPEASTDALGYHLLIPRIYLEHGRIDRLPDFVESDYPCLAEYAYLPVLALWGDEIVCKGIHFLVGLGALAAAGLIARKVSPGAPVLLPAALAISMPVAAIHMGWAWNDFFFVLDLLLAIAFLADHEASAARSATPCLAAGAMFGLATFTKYTFLLYGVALAPLLAWAILGRGWRARHALAFAAAALPIAALWTVKNWAFTGNPLYPFANGIFHSPYWSDTCAAFFRDANVRWEMPRFTWVHYALFPVTIPLLHPLVENQTGVMPILVLPFLFRRLRSAAGGFVRTFALLVAIAWAVMFHAKSRSLLALSFVAFAAAAAAIHEAPAVQGRLRAILIGLMTAVVMLSLSMTVLVTLHLFDPMAHFFGREDRAHYLARMALAQKAFDYLNSRSDVGKVAVIGIHEPYYLEKPYVFSSFGDTPVAQTLARGATSAGQIGQHMRDAGFTHVVLLVGAFDDPDRRALYSWTPEERARFEELLRDCAVVQSADGIEVLRLPRPQGPTP